jgi:hypothetical protein
VESAIHRNMQTAIVTGGNSGLGYYCARAIAAASPDWHVIIASRDHSKSSEAASSIIAEAGNSAVTAMEVDLASRDSIRRFATDFTARALPPLRAIVCNAGIQIVSGITYNGDGYETTFAVNHLGHFLLVNLLLQHLNNRARIVVVSSGTHNPGQFTGMPKPDYRDAMSVAKPDAGPAYLGRRAYYTALQRFFWNFALPALRVLPGINSARKSGLDLARLVLDPGLEGVSGRYFIGRRSVPSSKDSYDQRKAAELWESSVTMVRLKPEETILRLTTPADSVAR